MRLRSLAFVALMLMAPAVQAAPGDAACQRDIIVTDSQMRTAMERLESVGESEAGKCRAWRAHLDTLRKSRATFARCTVGADRARRLTELDQPIGEFQDLLKRSCSGK